MQESKNITISRRKFLAGSASAIATGTLLGATGRLFADPDVPAYGDWPYAKLDPEWIGVTAWAVTGARG